MDEATETQIKRLEKRIENLERQVKILTDKAQPRQLERDIEAVLRKQGAQYNL